MEEGAFVLEDDDWRIHAMPVSHPAPTLGLRVAYKPNGFNVTYSCDTSPDERVIRMAHHSDILVHEANLFEGSAPNVHSSIPEAASIAAQAEAERLILVHVPPGMTDAHLATARRHIFPNMDVGTELGVYPMAKGWRAAHLQHTTTPWFADETSPPPPVEVVILFRKRLKNPMKGIGFMHT